MATIGTISDVIPTDPPPFLASDAYNGTFTYNKDSPSSFMWWKYVPEYDGLIVFQGSETTEFYLQAPTAVSPATSEGMPVGGTYSIQRMRVSEGVPVYIQARGVTPDQYLTLFDAWNGSPLKDSYPDYETFRSFFIPAYYPSEEALLATINGVFPPFKEIASPLIITSSVLGPLPPPSEIIDPNTTITFTLGSDLSYPTDLEPDVLLQDNTAYSPSFSGGGRASASRVDWHTVPSEISTQYARELSRRGIRVGTQLTDFESGPRPYFPPTTYARPFPRVFPLGGAASASISSTHQGNSGRMAYSSDVEYPGIALNFHYLEHNINTLVSSSVLPEIYKPANAIDLIRDDGYMQYDDVVNKVKYEIQQVRLKISTGMTIPPGKNYAGEYTPAKYISEDNASQGWATDLVIPGINWYKVPALPTRSTFGPTRSSIYWTVSSESGPENLISDPQSDLISHLAVSTDTATATDWISLDVESILQEEADVSTGQSIYSICGIMEEMDSDAKPSYFTPSPGSGVPDGPSLGLNFSIPVAYIFEVTVKTVPYIIPSDAELVWPDPVPIPPPVPSAFYEVKNVRMYPIYK